MTMNATLPVNQQEYNALIAERYALIDKMDRCRTENSRAELGKAIATSADKIRNYEHKINNLFLDEVCTELDSLINKMTENQKEYIKQIQEDPMYGLECYMERLVEDSEKQRIFKYFKIKIENLRKEHSEPFAYWLLEFVNSYIEEATSQIVKGAKYRGGMFDSIRLRASANLIDDFGSFVRTLKRETEKARVLLEKSKISS